MRLSKAEPHQPSNAAITGRIPILAEAGGLRTSTGEGLRAKASMLRSSLTYVDRGLDKVSDVEHQLAWSIVRDMLEMPA